MSYLSLLSRFAPFLSFRPFSPLLSYSALFLLYPPLPFSSSPCHSEERQCLDEESISTLNFCEQLAALFSFSCTFLCKKVPKSFCTVKMAASVFGRSLSGHGRLTLFRTPAPGAHSLDERNPAISTSAEQRFKCPPPQKPPSFRAPTRHSVELSPFCHSAEPSPLCHSEERHRLDEESIPALKLLRATRSSLFSCTLRNNHFACSSGCN